MRLRVLGLLLLPLLLAGCAGTRAPGAAPAPTVTVTVTPAAATPKAGDSAPWDLHGVCAAESEVSTLIIWRRQQQEAHRLTSAQADAVAQAIAVQYLEFDQAGLPGSVQQDVAALAHRAGTFEHPRIDLAAKPVATARNHLARVCQDQGLTIGVVAQGG